MNESAKRGFAAMDPKRRRELASKGGQAAQQAGTGHRFTPEEGRAAHAHKLSKAEAKPYLQIMHKVNEFLVDYLGLPALARASVHGSMFIMALLEARRADNQDGLDALDLMIVKLHSLRNTPDAESMAQLAHDTADDNPAH